MRACVLTDLDPATDRRAQTVAFMLHQLGFETSLVGRSLRAAEAGSWGSLSWTTVARAEPVVPGLHETNEIVRRQSDAARAVLWAAQQITSHRDDLIAWSLGPASTRLTKFGRRATKTLALRGAKAVIQGIDRDSRRASPAGPAKEADECEQSYHDYIAAQTPDLLWACGVQTLRAAGSACDRVRREGGASEWVFDPGTRDIRRLGRSWKWRQAEIDWLATAKFVATRTSSLEAAWQQRCNSALEILPVPEISWTCEAESTLPLREALEVSARSPIGVCIVEDLGDLNSSFLPRTLSRVPAAHIAVIPRRVMSDNAYSAGGTIGDRLSVLSCPKEVDIASFIMSADFGITLGSTSEWVQASALGTYLRAKLPVVAAENGDLTAVVRRYDCGAVYRPEDSDDLALAMLAVFSEKMHFAENARKVSVGEGIQAGLAALERGFLLPRSESGASMEAARCAFGRWASTLEGFGTSPVDRMYERCVERRLQSAIAIARPGSRSASQASSA